jgi:hypothetical protein
MLQKHLQISYSVALFIISCFEAQIYSHVIHIVTSLAKKELQNVFNFKYIDHRCCIRYMKEVSSTAWVSGEGLTTPHHKKNSLLQNVVQGPGIEGPF